MLARELMTSPVVTCRPEWSIRRVIGVLHHHDITAAPVIDAAGRMVGIVSEMDALRDAFTPDPRASMWPVGQETGPAPRAVAEVMSERVLSVPESADVQMIAELMMSTGVKSVPVIRDGRPVGIVSRRDLVGVLAHSDRRIAADIRRALGDESGDEPDWRVRAHDGIVHLTARTGTADARIARILAETVPGVRGVEVTTRPPSAAGPPVAAVSGRNGRV